MACILCGVSDYASHEEHEKSREHRLNAAQLAVSAAHGHPDYDIPPRCPFCPPPRKRARHACRNKAHASALTECRRLVAEGAVAR
jgi:hypothetical protein